MAAVGHPRSGPAPDPNALRRDRKDDTSWRHLPSEGRLAEPPPFPLPSPSAREKAIWRTEWTRPQALVWEERGQFREVAIYVRALIVAEQVDARVDSRTLVLKMMDSLGVTTPGLARNRWIIDSSPTGAAVHNDSRRASAKERFRSIAGGAKG